MMSSTERTEPGARASGDDPPASLERLGPWCRRQALPLAISAACYLALFWPTWVRLVEYWIDDPDFSHGFIIPVVSGAILWAHRRELGQLPSRRSLAGFSLLAVSLGVFAAGYLIRTNVIQRLGLYGALLGGVWFAFGTALVRRKPFPFLFLVFMIPPHYQLLQTLRLTLKEFATRLSADLLPLFGVEASPQGNILVAGGQQLEVADACSGIRSLMAIVATATLFGYLFRTGLLRGSLLVLSAIPVTILINVLRIVIVAVAIVRFEVDLSRGLAHDALGLLVFGLSLILLFAIEKFLAWLFAWRGRSPDALPTRSEGEA